MKIRILLVEDDIEFMKKRKEIWEKENKDLEVVLSKNPRDAIKAKRRIDFDCLVVNYELPEMNRLEFLESLRDKENSIPLVFLTSIEKENLNINALNQDIDGVIKKECDAKTQLEKIMDIIFERPIV